MSSNAYAAALRLELAPSRRRRQWRWLTHAVVAATLPLLQSYWLIAAVACLLLYSLHRSRHDPALVLLWDSDGRWTLYEGTAATDATLAATAFAQPWLVILPLHRADNGRVQRIAIFPDMLPARDFRRLRVRLRGANETTAAR